MSSSTTTMFGRALRRRRSELSLSQQELAAELHVTTTTISRWENGHTMPGLHDTEQREHFVAVLGESFRVYASSDAAEGLYARLDSLAEAIGGIADRLDAIVQALDDEEQGRGNTSQTG